MKAVLIIFLVQIAYVMTQLPQLVINEEDPNVK